MQSNIISIYLMFLTLGYCSKQQAGTQEKQIRKHYRALEGLKHLPTAIGKTEIKLK